MLIDTHAHISCEAMKNVKETVLNNLSDDGVGLIVCPSYDFKTCSSTLDVVKQNERVFGALGIHPSEEAVYNNSMKDYISQNLNCEKIVAVGEIGLDYHYQNVIPKRQQNIMIEQMEIAKENKLPIIFHVRDAFDDFFNILSENKNLVEYGGVVHCFLGDKNNAKIALDLGLNISVTGAVTYPKNTSTHEAVKYIPLDRIMLETDSPYLAPQPVRGKMCIPQYVLYVNNFVAELKNINSNIVEEQTTKNALQFFYKMGKIWKNQ